MSLVEGGAVALLAGEDHHEHGEDPGHHPRHAVQVVHAARVVDLQPAVQLACGKGGQRQCLKKGHIMFTQ